MRTYQSSSSRAIGQPGATWRAGICVIGLILALSGCASLATPDGRRAATSLYGVLAVAACVLGDWSSCANAAVDAVVAGTPDR
jgi:hypothetical protein